MRVYVVVGEYHTFNEEHDWYSEYEEVLEVFVNEQDAKKYIAGHNRLRYEQCDPDSQKDRDLGNVYDDFRIDKFKLRTGWESE